MTNLKMASLALLVAFILFEKIIAQVDYCFVRDPLKSQLKNLGVSTPYSFVKGQIPISPVESCEPTRFWQLARHATRLPTVDEIEAMSALDELRDQILEMGTHRLCEEDVNLLRQWRWNATITPDKAQILAPVGYVESNLLGSDWKSVFPSIFEDSYDELRFNFHRTNTQRAEESCNSFAAAIFGAAPSLPSEPSVNYFLRPYDQCDAWSDRGKYNLTEKLLFVNSSIYQAMLQRVSIRLGFSSPLSNDKVLAIWEACRFDISWTPTDLPAWCAAFNSDDLEILAYSEDLNFYYLNGYGFEEQNRWIMCEAMQDLYRKMVAPSSSAVPMTASFGHGDALHLILTTFGIRKDVTPLRSDNFEEMRLSRLFRSSQMVPWNGQITLVRYECTTGVKIGIYANQELATTASWCPTGICPMVNFDSEFGVFDDADCPLVYCKT